MEVRGAFQNGRHNTNTCTSKKLTKRREEMEMCGAVGEADLGGRSNSEADTDTWKAVFKQNNSIL